MRKLMLVSTGFYIVVVTVLFFQAKTAFLEINKSLNTVQENQMNFETLISRFYLQLNQKIIELSKDTEDQNRNLGIALNKVKNSNLMAIGEVKNLIATYTAEVKNKNAVTRLLAVNALVESDGSTQQLLGEGTLKYNEGNFTEAIKVYRSILDADPSNTEALCYHNVSLYYQNPGDRSNFPGIRKNLIPLLEGDLISSNDKSMVLNVLLEISREESDSASMKQYQNALQQLEDGE